MTPRNTVVMDTFGMSVLRMNMFKPNGGDMLPASTTINMITPHQTRLYPMPRISGVTTGTVMIITVNESMNVPRSTYSTRSNRMTDSLGHWSAATYCVATSTTPERPTKNENIRAPKIST